MLNLWLESFKVLTDLIKLRRGATKLINAVNWENCWDERGRI